jgi:GAF domain-containing protein
VKSQPTLAAREPGAAVRGCSCRVHYAGIGRLWNKAVATGGLPVNWSRRASVSDGNGQGADEAQELFGGAISAIVRFEDDGTVVVAAAHGLPSGRRWSTEDTRVAWTALQTGRSARFDDLPADTVPIAQDTGIKSAVGGPLIVDGHLWGVMVAASTEGPMPPDTEARLASFTELVATAIANAESSAERRVRRGRARAQALRLRAALAGRLVVAGRASARWITMSRTA